MSTTEAVAHRGVRLSIDEPAFLASLLGGSEYETLEDEAKNWIEHGAREESVFIEEFGEDEALWHQGFADGIGEALSELVWHCKGIELRKNTFHDAPQTPEITIIQAPSDPITIEIEIAPANHAPPDIRATLAELGWSKGEAARRLSVSVRRVRAWCSGEAIPEDHWRRLQGFFLAETEQPAQPDDAPTPVESHPRPASASGGRSFTAEEQAAIDAALAAGRLTRVESGEWPDTAHLFGRWKSQ